MRTRGKHSALLTGAALCKEAQARQTVLDNFGTLDAAEAFGRLSRRYGREE